MQPLFVIKLIERVSRIACYDIETERGVVADNPEAATQRTEIVSHIRRALLLNMVGSCFDVQVEPAPEVKEAAPPELSEKRKRLCHSIFTTAIEGGINDWARCETYRWMLPGAPPELSVEDASDIDNFFAVILEIENPNDDGSFPKHRVDLAGIDRGINRLASREATNGGSALGEHGHWHNLGLKLNAEGAEDVDFDASDADAIVQAGLFNDIVYG